MLGNTLFLINFTNYFNTAFEKKKELKINLNIFYM